MELNPFARPHLNSLYPTVDTALWLVRLRWVAVVGQLTTICVVAFWLKYDIQILPLLMLVALTASTNTFIWTWLNWFHNQPAEAHSRTITAIVVCAQILDVVCLSGLLFLSGGVFNPFALFYFVNLAMAGLILPTTWAWLIALLCILSQSLLLMHYLPLTSMGLEFRYHEAVLGSEERFAYWISFASSTCVVTYFITMPMAELRQREQLLAEVQQQKARSQKLEAMATLAAGAGHELASPLSTIAVVAKEMSRNMEKMEVPKSLHADVALIRSELDRCREILNRMKSSAGEAAAEVLDPVTVASLLHEVVSGIRDANRLIVPNVEDLPTRSAVFPVQALALAIRNVVQNAIDASPEDSHVHLQVQADDHQWRICVDDEGHGMDPEVLRRIGEPFFTTKEPGRGMGMGVFLTQNVVSRLGGTIAFESHPEQGTQCTITIPVR